MKKPKTKDERRRALRSRIYLRAQECARKYTRGPMESQALLGEILDYAMQGFESGWESFKRWQAADTKYSAHCITKALFDARGNRR